MKYLIAFAGITTVVSAIGVTTVDPKCNRDNCLRNVIASNLPTRPGYADCTSFLKTTITPAPETSPSYYTTISTVTDPPTTTIVTSAYTGGAVSPNKRDNVYGYRGGFRKIRREDPPEPGTAVTVTNPLPSYIVSSCTSERGKDASQRYSSACSCVGAVEQAPTTVAIPTVYTPEAVPDPSVTFTETPIIVRTAYSLHAQISGSPSSISDKYIATSATLIAPVATAAADAATLLIQPDGKTTLGGKLLIAKVSSLTSDARYLTLAADDVTVPVGATAVNCQIAADSTITCTTNTDFDRWILHTGTSNSLRLLKQGASPPVSHLYNTFVIKAVSPA